VHSLAPRLHPVDHRPAPASNRAAKSLAAARVTLPLRDRFFIITLLSSAHELEVEGVEAGVCSSARFSLEAEEDGAVAGGFTGDDFSVAGPGLGPGLGLGGGPLA
jgi:hypothetical protein